jgi:D-alanine-D-alanine ligase
LASALGLNKNLSKTIFKKRGLPTLPWTTVTQMGQPCLLPLPVVVKPVDGGSAIGTSIVKRKTELRSALGNALKYSHEALIEKFIPGKELTASILGERVLPLIEIVPHGEFYNYKAKYQTGMSEHIIPARISKKTEKKVYQFALEAHQALGCRAFSRVDFILDSKENPWILEINTIPGMTPTSLFPDAAKAAGLSFPELLIKMMAYSI